MKKLIIPLLLMVMAYHNGKSQNKSSANNYPASGQNIRIAQINKNKAAVILQGENKFVKGRSYAQRLQSAVAQLEQARTIHDYKKLEQTSADLSLEQPQNWLAHYYVAYCDARMAFLYQNESDYRLLEHYCIKGSTYARKAGKLLDPVNDKKALSELYTVVSMLYWNAGHGACANGGHLNSNFSNRYLSLARQLDPHNPRTLYWDAWIKFNAPKNPGDRKLARDMAEVSFSLIRENAPGTWPN